jgi:dTDP-4-amino-4,6-dideoxygalactose transaminase
VDKYTWIDMGSSYLPSEILAAFLYAQLEAREQIQAQRRRIWEFYRDHLQKWAKANAVSLPVIPAHCDQSYHLFYLLLPSLDARRRLMARLEAAGILGVFHYLPLHLSAMGRRFGGRAGDCPVTESVSDRLLRLPFYNDLSESEQSEVVAAITRDP